MSPRKAAEQNWVQGFWIKTFTTLHKYKAAHQLDNLVKDADISSWLTKEKTMLLSENLLKVRHCSTFVF